jgi:hypothetical protein
MFIKNRFICSFLLATVLAAPMAMIAAPVPAADGVRIRVYDRDHKDYHNWDDHENHSWGAYLNDNHRKDHEFKRANRRERSDYWRWRHSHPD